MPQPCNNILKGVDTMAYGKCDGKAIELAIDELAAGNKSALAELYRLTSVQIYAYSLSVLKNTADAQDVLQDVMLEAWRAAPDYKSRGKPMAWLIGIAKNICRMKKRELLKKSSVPAEVLLDGLSDSGLSPETVAVIRISIESLPDIERETVLLHAVSGLKHREIARLLDVPLSTVLSRYQRGIKKLTEELEGALQ